MEFVVEKSKVAVYWWRALVTVFADKRPIRQRVQDMRATVHRFPMVSRCKNALQEDRSLSELCKDEKCLPDMPSWLGIWYVLDSFGLLLQSIIYRGLTLLQFMHTSVGDDGGGHWLVRMEWHPAGWSVCLPLLIFPCTIKSTSSLLAPAHPGGPGNRAVKRLWCGGCGSGRYGKWYQATALCDAAVQGMH